MSLLKSVLVGGGYLSLVLVNKGNASEIDLLLLQLLDSLIRQIGLVKPAVLNRLLLIILKQLSTLKM